MSDLILAIDQGTTNTKAVAVDGAGRIVAQASVPMQVDYPQPGWAEQSAIAIWKSVQDVVARVVDAVGAERIEALAISNQRETIVLWDAESGEPVAPAIIWQCRRSAERCAQIRAAGFEPEIVARTGLGVDPLFPAAKIAWLLDSVPDGRARAASGQLRAGTIDSWLIWTLTGGSVHATDHSNASRTQLLNTMTLQWDDELARIFAVPLSVLPELRTSDAAFGVVAAGRTTLRTGTPIRGVMGDSHAALYGHGVRNAGPVKATYGTGSSLMTLAGRRISSSHGLSGTIAWSTRDGVAYALEGNISVSGQAAAFMAEMLGLDDAAALSALALTVPDSNGVVFVPALVGLGAPYWRDDARGLISGLSLGTKPAHLARAALEAIAFQVADVFSAMESDLGSPLARLSADGGASRNDFLMQFQADILDRPVGRSEVAEVSALGVAQMASVSLGRPSAWQTSPEARFLSKMPATDRSIVLDRWHTAVGRALGSMPGP